MYTIVIEKRAYYILNFLLQNGKRRGELDFIREKRYIEYFIIVQKRTGARRVLYYSTEKDRGLGGTLL